MPAMVPLPTATGPGVYAARRTITPTPLYQLAARPVQPRPAPAPLVTTGPWIAKPLRSSVTRGLVIRIAVALASPMLRLPVSR